MGSVKVSWEDQQRINAYGRTTTRRREIEAELNELDEKIKTFEDASSEITLNDEGLKFKVGDCFIEVSGDEAEEMLAQQQEKTRKTIQSLQKELETVKKTLAELKVELVQHFGDSISL